MRTLRNLLLFVLLILTVSCSTATVKTPDCEATYTSIWKDHDKLSMNVCGAKGNTTGAYSDTSMVELLTELLSRAK